MRSRRSGRPKGSKSGYIPTLDGWRALAILAVMIYHCSLWSWHGLNDRWIFDHGDFGVDIFFAISGLLITTRLLEEEKKTGKLHLPGFYIRRVLRIQPAALLFLAAVLALHLAAVVPISRSAFLSALFLFRNYLNVSKSVGWATGHFWSLSVEEHYYLALPLLLVLVKRRRVLLLATVAGLFAVWRSIAERHGWAGPGGHTDLMINYLLLPSLLAVLLQNRSIRQGIARSLSPMLGLVLAGVILLPLWCGWKHAIGASAPLAPAALVVSTMLHPESFLGRFLELAPLRFVGRISYGLYLWQQLFFTGHFVPAQRYFGVFSHAPLSFAAVFAVATISYFLVERPCMRLGHRLARPAVAGRPELQSALVTPYSGAPAESSLAL